jgi:hypothetical protein
MRPSRRKRSATRQFEAEPGHGGGQRAQRPMALLSAAPASATAGPAPGRAARPCTGAARTPASPGAGRRPAAPRRPAAGPRHLHRVQRAQAQLHGALRPGRPLTTQHRGRRQLARVRCAAPQRQHQRALAAAVPPRPTASCPRAGSRRRLRPAQTSPPPRRAAHPPPARWTARGRKALAGKGVGHHAWRAGRPATAPENVRPPGPPAAGPGQRQAQQGLAGLHDLPGLHRAHSTRASAGARSTACASRAWAA